MSNHKSRILLPIHRFSLKNPSYAYLEMDSPMARDAAVVDLTDQSLHDHDVVVAEASADPEVLCRKYLEFPPQVFPDMYSEYTAEDTLKPILEGQRVFIGQHGSSKPPPSHFRNELVKKLEPFSLEALSKVCLAGKSHFAFIDAATREEADRIIANLNGKDWCEATARVERVLIEKPAHGWEGRIAMDRISPEMGETPLNDQAPACSAKRSGMAVGF